MHTSRNVHLLAALGLVSVMLHDMTINAVVPVCLYLFRKKLTIQGCTKQAALERQGLSCTKLAQHEPESIKMTVACNLPGIL